MVSGCLQYPLKCWYILQQGWSSETLCSVSEARHQRPHIVWPHLHEMSRMGKSIATESRWLPGVGSGAMGSDSYWIWGFFGDNGNVLEVNGCLHKFVNMLKKKKPLNCILLKGKFCGMWIIYLKSYYNKEINKKDHLDKVIHLPSTLH